MKILKKIFFKKKPLFIDYEYQYVGGPKSFMSNLKKYLESKNFFTTSNLDYANAIFFATRYDIDVVKEFSKQGKFILQRLDGVYSKEVHGDDYNKIPDYKFAKEIYQNYATHYIFQSEYSQKQCHYAYGEPTSSNVYKIINGCDTSIFYPAYRKHIISNRRKIKFVTDGFVRNLSMIQPIVFALNTIAKDFDLELHVIGKVNKDLEKYLDYNFVVYHGVRNLDYIAKIVRSSDIYIFTHLNPPCPNSVIQAVCSGIPVVTFDSGSMREILFFNTNLLVPMPKKLFHTEKDININDLVEKILLVINNYKEYKKIALQNTNLYSLESMGKKYLEIFESVL
jgi:glycosyltransferase involved in cell wall biosynthesis